MGVGLNIIDLSNDGDDDVDTEEDQPTSDNDDPRPPEAKQRPRQTARRGRRDTYTQRDIGPGRGGGGGGRYDGDDDDIDTDREYDYSAVYRMDGPFIGTLHRGYGLDVRLLLLAAGWRAATHNQSMESIVCGSRSSGSKVTAGYQCSTSTRDWCD